MEKIDYGFQTDTNERENAQILYLDGAASAHVLLVYDSSVYL